MRRELCLALLAAMVLLPGCIKSKRRLVVYPDGSGKVEAVVGIGKTLAGFGKLGGEENVELGIMSLDKIKEDSKGIVWGTARGHTEGDYKYQEISGYFEDINEVRIARTTYQWRKLDDGSYELKFAEEGAEYLELDNPFGDAENGVPKRMIRGLTRAMLKDLEVSLEFKLPGEVSRAEGLDSEGREAKLMIDVDRLLDMLEKPEEAVKSLEGTIIVKPEGDIREELDAFRAEMRKALAAAEKEASSGEEGAPREEEQRKEEGKKRRFY